MLRSLKLSFVPPAARRARRLLVEPLEDRAVPAAAFVPNEVLVQFAPGVGESVKAAARGRVGGVVEERIETGPMRAAGLGALEVVKVAPGLSVAAAAQALRAHPGVRFAEPNWVYTTQATPTDSYYTGGRLWGTYGDDLPSALGPKGTTNPYGSQAEKAWAAGATGSKGVYVGVIDEGIQYTHPDLDGQVWTNPFDPADGVDNDGNGYADDVHGWDFANNDNTVYDGGKSGGLDDHGTHVSGTIAGRANNGGVVGVNWDVTLISAKFLGRNGGTTANAIKAVDYFTNLKTRHGLNIVATNNSWTGGGYSQALADAIGRANAAGILFVAAAGNSGTNNDAAPSYPSGYDLPNVIAVASIDGSGRLASTSQYGATTVDIGAPGVGILSTTAFSNYSTYDGTSMATPHVTGAAALYAATHPGATAAQIKDAILSSATPTPSLAGKTVTGGRLNVSGFAATAVQFGVASYAVVEGAGLAIVTVTRSGGTVGTVSVGYATGGGTATPEADYTPVSGTLTFGPGETSKTFVVPVVADSLYEGDETVDLTLSSPCGGAGLGGRVTATLMVADDDQPPAVSVSGGSLVPGSDGNYYAVFTVTLSAASGLPASVGYATRDGTAVAGTDYDAVAGTLTFAAGETSATVTVRVYPTLTGDGTFFLDLSALGGVTVGTGTGQAVV